MSAALRELTAGRRVTPAPGHGTEARRRWLRGGWAAGGAAVLAVVAAGCSGGGGTGSSAYGAAPHASAPPPAQAAAVVRVTDTELGRTLADRRGRTLYLFEGDKTSRSTCDGACATLWPPLVTGAAPKAGQGAQQALLATASRTGGSRQVTYHGHPLYYFSGDRRAGDTSGQGLDDFGAEWYALAPTGDEIDED